MMPRPAISIEGNGVTRCGQGVGGAGAANGRSFNE
jgi:hypothetical protein